MAELRTPHGHTLLLPEGRVSIGADPANDVPVAAHLGLAPVHFRLQPWEGGHFLEDAGSGLGTLVNGHPVNWKPLTHGDVIVAGELEVVYEQQATATASPVPVIAAPMVASVAAITPPAVSAPVPTLPAPALPSISSPIVAPPETCFAPPAWLPEDLLPESYRMLPSPTRNDAETCATVEIPAPGPQAAKSRRAARLLPLAALMALLAWAGHAVWQGDLLNSFRQPAAAPAPPEATAPAQLEAGLPVVRPTSETVSPPVVQSGPPWQ